MQMNPEFLPELPIYLPPKIDCLVEYCVRFSSLSKAEKRTEEAHFSLIANLLLIIHSRLDSEPVNIHLLEGKLAQARVDRLVYEAFAVVQALFPDQIEEPLVQPTGEATIRLQSDNFELGEKKNGYLRRFFRVWRGYRKNMPYDLNLVGRLLAFPGYLMARWELNEPEELAPKFKRSLKHRF